MVKTPALSSVQLLNRSGRRKCAGARELLVLAVVLIERKIRYERGEADSQCELFPICNSPGQVLQYYNNSNTARKLAIAFALAVSMSKIKQIPEGAVSRYLQLFLSLANHPPAHLTSAPDSCAAC